MQTRGVWPLCDSDECLTLLKQAVSDPVPFSRAGNFWTLFIG